MAKRYIEAEKARYQKNKERLTAYSRKWARDNKEKRNATRRKRYALKLNYPVRKKYPPKRLYKIEVFNHYGNVCICCSESVSKLLTIDHIENNGREHGGVNYRYKGEALYRHLAKLQYPTGIQILCFNCNIGRRNNKGICPHKGEKAI